MQSVLIRCLFNLCEILFNPCNANIRAELKSVSSVQSVVIKRGLLLGGHISVIRFIRCLFYLCEILFNPCNSNVRAELNPFNLCNLWSKRDLLFWSYISAILIRCYWNIFEHKSLEWHECLFTTDISFLQLIKTNYADYSNF